MSWLSNVLSGLFTAETQRGGAATKSRNISRKGAKAAKEKINPNLAFLASWRE
jgi:hypothetical protein